MSPPVRELALLIAVLRPQASPAAHVRRNVARLPQAWDVAHTASLQ